MTLGPGVCVRARRQRREETLRPVRRAVPRTNGTRFPVPPRLRVGKPEASSFLLQEPALNGFPGVACGWVDFGRLQATVELFLLCGGRRQHGAFFNNTVPNGLDKPDALGDRKTIEV